MATATDCRYEALAQQSDALRVIFESLPWGVIVANREGRFLFSNPAAERILGIGMVEALPETCTSPEGWYLADQISLMPPDRLPLVRAIRGQEVVDELIFVRSSRHPGVWIRVNAWPLKEPSGEISGGVVMFHDFTRGREALQSFVLLSRVVEQTADSVVLTDTEGVIHYVNPAFETTTGFSKEEALGKTPRILKSGRHDAEFYRQMWAQFTHGLSFKGMIINRKKTGELYCVQQTITSMRDEAGHLTHFVSFRRTLPSSEKNRSRSFSCNWRGMSSSASMRLLP